MGLAQIVPGISGGTIALIEGIYEKMIAAIKSINLTFLVYMLKALFDRKKFPKAKQEFLKIDLKFLLPLGIGMIIAFLAAAGAVDFLINNYPAQVYSFFFTLILLSAGIVYGRVKEINIKTFIPGIAGFIFAIVFLGLEEATLSPSLPIIFITGFLAISTMILPGISGSFVVLFLGQYEHMLTALSEIIWPDVLAFLIGGVFSLMAFSRVLNHFLKNYYSHTIFFLSGLMIGGLRLPIEEVMAVDNLLGRPMTLAGSIIAGAVGVIIIAISEYKKRQMDKDTTEISI